MRRTLLLPTVLLVFLGILCFWRTAAPRELKDAVTFAEGNDFKTLDPNAMDWASDLRVAMGLWEGLASYDPKTMQPIPATAESWEVSPDRMTYTFHIRPTARWSNGDPVTARDFLFAWRRVLTPATAAQYVALLYTVAGAKEYNEKLSTQKGITPEEALAAFDQVQAKALDDRTLVVHLAAPCTYFLDLVAFPTFYPVHERSMRPFLVNGNPLQGYDGRWLRPPNVVTNGPYQFIDWRFHESLLLEPNPYYWDRASVRCNHLRIASYKDQRAGLLAYQSGVVDIMVYVPQQFGPDLLAQVNAGKRKDIFWGPSFGSYYYVFNCKRPPYTDPRVRRALTLAIDREQIVRHVTRMGQPPLGVLVPPHSIRRYQSPEGLKPNIPEAQRLLAEAGFPGGAGFPEVEITFNNEEPTHARIAQAIGQMWQNHLHLRVTYRGTELSTFGKTREEHNFDIARGGWTGDYPDPTTFLDLGRSDNGNNDGQYENPAFDAMMARADRETDPEKRFAILRQAETILVEQDLPFIPIYQYCTGMIFDSDKIGGCVRNVRDLYMYKYLYRK